MNELEAPSSTIPTLATACWNHGTATFPKLGPKVRKCWNEDQPMVGIVDRCFIHQQSYALLLLIMGQALV